MTRVCKMMTSCEPGRTGVHNSMNNRVQEIIIINACLKNRTIPSKRCIKKYQRITVPIVFPHVCSHELVFNLPGGVTTIHITTEGVFIYFMQLQRRHQNE